MPRHQTIDDFIKESHTQSKYVQQPLKNVIALNYRLVIHPIFDNDLNPFSYNGTVFITIISHKSNVKTIELDANDLDIDTQKVVLTRNASVSTKMSTETTVANRLKRDTEEDTSTTTSATDEEPIAKFDGTESTSTEGTPNEATESAANEPTSTKNVYEFLELTTGIDATSDESNENSNSTGETLTSTTQKIDSGKHKPSNIIKEVYTDMLIKKTAFDKKRGKIIITLGLKLLKGSEYILRVDFRGNMTTTGPGLVYTNYKDDAEKDK